MQMLPQWEGYVHCGLRGKMPYRVYLWGRIIWLGLYQMTRGTEFFFGSKTLSIVNNKQKKNHFSGHVFLLIADSDTFWLKC